MIVKNQDTMRNASQKLNLLKHLCMVFLFIGGMIFLSCGCATLYVADSRSEYNDQGNVIGIFAGDREYPRVYPATYIATMVEIPTWWSPRHLQLERKYQLYLWPLGAPLSVVDVGISLTTDTIMLPYDAYKVLTKQKGE